MFIFFFTGYMSVLYMVKYIYDKYYINTLYIVRGISGSGKSHYVENSNNHGELLTYVEFNIYDFLDDDKITSKKIVESYNKCFKLFIMSLNKRVNLIYITNPFIHKWEYENYVLLAKSYGYKVKVIEIRCEEDDLQKCLERSKNVNNFNLIKKQFDNFEYDDDNEIHYVDLD